MGFDMDTFKIIVILIYLIGLPTWVILWKQLIGFEWLKKISKLKITFYGGMFALIVNLIFAYVSEIPEYGVELGIYAYVERNAITVAGLSLAIATFIIVTFSRVTTVEQDEKMHLFLQAVFTSFLMGILGVLPLYWVPQIYGWLTILRHLKTIPELYSVFILGSAMIIYVDSIRMQDLKDLATQLTQREKVETYKKNKIEWDPSLSVGINEVDEQHMMLIYRVKELSEAIERGEDASFLFETMNFLIDYTEHHFGTEEKYMLEYKYPEYGSHQVKHDEFKKSLKGMAQNLVNNGATAELADQVNVFLVNWLLDHIQGIDQELGVYMSGK
jgi:hemerythrin-like metal-binding protein